MDEKAITVLIGALAASVRGEAYAGRADLTEEQRKELFDAALEQKLLPLALQALYCDPSLTEHPELLERVRRLAARQTAGQIQRNAAFDALLPELEKDGLTPVTVKGALCRALYPRGELRLSGDEDLLLPEEQFTAGCGRLRAMGFLPDKDDPDGTAGEIAFVSPNSGLRIELHRRLFDGQGKLFAELNGRFSAGSAQTYIYEEGETALRGLSPHDHMIYLMAHAFKHFAYSGFGLRQLCDIGLWAERYEGQIDWPALQKTMDGLRAGRFTEAVLTLAKTKLGLARQVPVTETGEETCGMLLRDLIAGGIYGTADDAWRHSAGVTKSAVARGRGGRGNVLFAVFPPRERLAEEYPVLKKHPALLPAVWVRRLARYAGQLAAQPKEKRAGASVSIATERMALMRRLDVID